MQKKMKRKNQTHQRPTAGFTGAGRIWQENAPGEFAKGAESLAGRAKPAPRPCANVVGRGLHK